MKAKHATVIEVTETEAKNIEFLVSMLSGDEILDILEAIADRKTSSNDITIIYREA